MEEVYCSAVGGGELQKVPVNMVGAAGGRIQVQSKDKRNTYNYAYSSHLASACKYSRTHLTLAEAETELISTKIVEIAPQFVLCNFTSHQLMFQQEQAGHIFNLLYQGKRAPYHWTDPNKPQLIRFKP